MRSAMLYRSSATAPRHSSASNGFFQQNLDSGNNCQLIRVLLPAESPYFPEISGGKHRFTIRFLQREDTLSRPVQAKDDIEFDLHCCIL